MADESNETVWVAIANKARTPSELPEGTRVVRFSDRTLQEGQRSVIVAGVGKITAHVPSKAIVDCFKFRRKLAEAPTNIQVTDLLDILQWGVGAYARRVQFCIKAIRGYSEICRMTKVMAPYLDALENRRGYRKRELG